MGGTPPPSYGVFFNRPPSKSIPPPMWHPPFKKKALLPSEPPPPPLKSETSFQEMIPREILEKSEIVIDTCVSVIKQHRKMMAEIPQESDFITWSI